MRVDPEFAKIAPKWAARMRDMGEWDSGGCSGYDGLNITEHCNCVVGEAHLFDGNYCVEKHETFCRDCSRFAMQFIHTASLGKQREFVAHMRRAHPELVAKSALPEKDREPLVVSRPDAPLMEANCS